MENFWEDHRAYFWEVVSVMALTPKQEKFCQCIADGMTQADAYRQSYSASKMSGNSIYSKASELMADGKISSRVAEIKAQLEEKALWTREDSVRALKSVIEGGRPSDVTGAVKELNSMHGYNEPKKMELTGKDGGPMQIKTFSELYGDTESEPN
jgi:phage terminase small subunit